MDGMDGCFFSKQKCQKHQIHIRINTLCLKIFPSDHKWCKINSAEIKKPECADDHLLISTIMKGDVGGATYLEDGAVPVEATHHSGCIFACRFEAGG